MDVGEGVALPPRGELPGQLRRLLATPGRGSIMRANWPLCCERLATLISAQGDADALADIEARAGSLDLAHLEMEMSAWGGKRPGAQQEAAAGWAGILGCIRTGEHSGEGINVFQCRDCGRLFVGTCAP